MDISFFGDFLLHRGLINQEQLNFAVDYQLKQNRSIGQIGLDENLLTKKQIKKIKKIQRKEDKKFGQIALENSILFHSQLDVILEKQKKTNIVFGDALKDLGYLSCNDVDNLVRVFEKLQQNKKKHIYTELAFCDKHFILEDSVTIFNNLFYRSFQEHIKFKKVDLDKKSDENTIYLSLKLKGDIEVEYILALKKELKHILNLSKKSKLIELFSELISDMVKRVAINLSSRDIIVTNSEVTLVDIDNSELSDFDQLKFITTVGDINLFIKV